MTPLVVVRPVYQRQVTEGGLMYHLGQIGPPRDEGGYNNLKVINYKRNTIFQKSN